MLLEMWNLLWSILLKIGINFLVYSVTLIIVLFFLMMMKCMYIIEVDLRSEQDLEDEETSEDDDEEESENYTTLYDMIQTKLVVQTKELWREYNYSWVSIPYRLNILLQPSPFLVPLAFGLPIIISFLLIKFEAENVKEVVAFLITASMVISMFLMILSLTE